MRQVGQKTESFFAILFIGWLCRVFVLFCLCVLGLFFVFFCICSYLYNILY